MRARNPARKKSRLLPALAPISTFARVAALSIVLYACSSPLQKSPDEPQPVAGRAACIRVEALSEWQPLDDHSLLLSMPESRRAHLITLAMPIENLATAGDVDVIDGDLDGFICPGGVDGIVVEECLCAWASIASIEYLSETRTAELRGEPSVIL